MQSIIKEGNTILSTIANFATAAVEDEIKYAEKINAKAGFLGGSISNYTKDLVMTFPLMCDNSLPITTASLVSKASERNIVTMLEMLFTSMNIKGKDGIKVLSAIHQNIKSDYDIDDIVDTINKYAESATLDEKKIKDFEKIIKEQVKIPAKSFPVNSFSENSLNDYMVYNIYGNISVREAKTAPAKKTAPDNNQPQKENEYPVPPKMLMDQDVKKCNELSPTLMVIRYINPGTNKLPETKETFVAGVKSRLINVDSTDIIERLIAKNKTKISFLNLIRATTGEIGFISDFLLCTKQAKIDAKNAVKKGPAAKMWAVLQNRSTKNNFNKIRKAGNDASAITTLLINQETVNILKKEYNFDLEVVKNTKMIMDAYNLLCICICDESIEAAKFFYAGNDSYEVQAYTYLEKENNSNNGRKEIINLLNNYGR